MAVARRLAVAVILLSLASLAYAPQVHAYLSPEPPKPRLRVGLERLWAVGGGLPIAGRVALDPRGELVAATSWLYPSRPWGLAELVVCRWDGGIAWRAPVGAYLLSWSPDGRYLAALGDHLWVYTRSGDLAWSYNDTVLALSWSPRGRYLAVGTDKELLIFSSDGIVAGRVKLESVVEILWSPRGGMLFVVSAPGYDWVGYMVALNGTILWNSLDNLGVPRVDLAAWSPDGRYIAIAWGSTVVVAGVDGKRLWSDTGFFDVRDLKWIRGGRELVVATTGGESIYTLNGTLEAYTQVPSMVNTPFSINGDGILATTDWNETNVTVYAPGGRILWRARPPASRGRYFIREVAWSPDGSKLLVATRQGFVVYSSNGSLLWGRSDLGPTVAYWRPDGHGLLVVSSAAVITYDDAGHPLYSAPHGFGRIWWSSDGNYLAVDAGIPVLYNSRGELVARIPVPGEVGYIAWSPSGPRLAVASDIVDVYDIEGRPLWGRPLERRASLLAWSPTGEMIAAISGTGFFIVNSSNGAVITEKSFPERLSALTWTPSGDRLLVAYEGEGGAEVYSWNGTSLGVIVPMVYYNGLPIGILAPEGFAWNPGGRLLAAYSSGGLVVLNATNHWSVEWSLGYIDVARAAWSPDGRHLAVLTRRAGSAGAGESWALRVYTINGREVWERTGLGYPVYLGWTPNGSAIVVASVVASLGPNGGLRHVDGFLTVYSLAGELALNTSIGPFEYISLSPKGLLAVSNTTSVKVYRLSLEEERLAVGEIIVKGPVNLEFNITGPGGSGTFELPGALTLWVTPGTYTIAYIVHGVPHTIKVNVEEGGRVVVSLPASTPTTTSSAGATRSTGGKPPTSSATTSPPGATLQTTTPTTPPGGAQSNKSTVTPGRHTRGLELAGAVLILAIAAAALALTRRR